MNRTTKIRRESKKSALVGVICAMVWAAPGLAVAQTATYVPEDEIAGAGEESKVDGTLGVSSTFSLASNQNVVGQVDGFSMLFGVGLLGGVDYLKGSYEMRNTLKLNTAWARTPVIEQFIKTNDVLDVENLHNYFLLKWFGVFGRLSLRTNIFPTEVVLAEPMDFATVDANGDPDVIVSDTRRFRLNDQFSPLTLHESLGVFAEPVKTRPISLSVRLGGGARQTFVDSVYVVDDDDATADITEVQLLDTVIQGGAEAFLGARGSFQEKRVGYQVGASVMLPFLNNDPQDRAATELTRIAAEADVTFGVFSWLNFVYSFKFINDPQLVEEPQIQNNLMLTFQYTLIERDTTAEETSPSEVEKAKAAAAAAEAKAAAAEAKAEAAEERAAEVQRELEEAREKLEQEEAEGESAAPDGPELPEGVGEDRPLEDDASGGDDAP